MATGATRAAIDDTPTTIQNAATAAAVGDSYACKGWANVAVQITGTYTTASTTFQITEDGTNWVSTEGVNTATGVSSPTATANGVYLVNCAGAEYFRANLTTIVGTSQSVVVRGTPFDGATAGLGAAGETVTANQGTAGSSAWKVDDDATQVLLTGPTVGTQSVITSTTTAVTIFALNASAKQRTVFNDSTAVLYVGLSATTVTTSLYTVQVAAGGYYEVPWPVYTGKVWGIWSAVNGNARVNELA